MQNRKIRWLLICGVLFIVYSRVQAYDVISSIQYPLTARPAIVQRGDTLQILCAAPSGASGWQVDLSLPFYQQSLVPAKTIYDSQQQRWTLFVLIPEDFPEELFDLRVRSSHVDDAVTHAVKVVSKFKNSYYFVHLPDLHLPSVAWIGFYDDPNTVPELMQIFRELEIINPEFVLQTGDVVDDGRQEAQYRIAQELIQQCPVPIFLSGGNHDLWYDGHTNWYRYFSPVMNYSFNYGAHHFTGLEMYDIPTVTFTAEQMDWLRTDLQESIDRGDGLRALFYHYDESRQINDDFVDRYQIDLIVYGHTHINGENTLGSRQALNLNTSFTMNNNGEFRLVKIAGNSVVEYPVLNFKHLKVEYSPANDGTNWRVTARIENRNPVRFENGLIKFRVRKDPAGYEVQGGQLLQVIPGDRFDVYYVQVAIEANSVQEVSIRSLNPPGDAPPVISSWNPPGDTVLVAGRTMRFTVTASDPQGQTLTYTWFRDGQPISGAGQPTFDYTPDVSFVGLTRLTVRASDGTFADEHTWWVEVLPYADKPRLETSNHPFFPLNQELVLRWIEPYPMKARLEYGPVPGNYTGQIPETGESEVRFIPEQVGMGVGLYYCRITDGNVSSDPFMIVIESPQAPKMLYPIGNIDELSPVFSWEPVPGVPYYMVICSDQEIIIKEDPVTGDMTLEGANPIWAVLTPETSVRYGTPDPSGTFTSAPAPLIPGKTYWWGVLNVYGPRPELASTVQSGISEFTVNLPPPDLDPPQLVSPAHGDTLDADVITFTWQPVVGATAYHFYPFKIEEEMGIETARPVWESILATTETRYDYPARELLVDGVYRWRVAAVAENGMEVQSESRDFYYRAPAAILNIYTYDSRNTATTADDVPLPRVQVTYTPISGVFNALPLSTDLHGARENFKLAPGSYQFKLQKEGYDDLVDTLTFENGKTYTLRFRLHPSKSSISGRVVDNQGDPVPDAAVTLQHALRSEIAKTVTTDAQGQFSASVLPGPYSVQAEKNGYQPSAALSVTVQSGENLVLSKDLVLIKNTNVIAGTVVNQASQPVFGARVVLTKGEDQLETFTDANGQFRFVVANGTWTLHVEKDGFVSPADRRISVYGGQTVTISPSPVLKPNAAILSGTVTDGFRVLSGATVSAYPVTGQAYATQTDDYGQFTLNVPPGAYTLEAERAGYSLARSVQVKVDAGETHSGLEIQMTPLASKIRGKVTTDGITPVADALVRASGVEVRTGAGGSYELAVQYGTHVVEAVKEGFTSSPPETVSVEPGQVVEGVDFILAPNASVFKGRVVSGGAGVRQALVVARNSRTFSTLTDDNGYYVLNVEAGTWNLTASKEGFLPATRDSVMIGVGQTVTGINFYLKLNLATVSGTVREKNSGQPLRNVQVQLEGTDLMTTTASDGSFYLQVEPGSYVLLFDKSGYASVQLTTGALQANQEKAFQVEMEPLPSRITGKVVDEDGLPVDGAWIYAIAGTDTFRTQTSATGEFSLDVSTGTYRIVVTKDGFKTVAAVDALRIAAGEEKSIATVQLSRLRGDISGTVTNAAIGQAVPLVKIVARSSTYGAYQTLTDGQGKYSFRDNQGRAVLPPGNYTVVASKVGYRADTVQVDVRGDRTVAADFRLQKNTGKVSGKILSNLGTPVAGATVLVQVMGTSQVFTAITDENGEFSLEGLPPGTYEVRVAKSGYTSPEPQQVGSGASLQVTLIKNDGRLLGYVKDAETDQPIRGARVYIADNHGNNGTAYTNSQGFYEIGELPRLYPYDVAVSKGGYRNAVRKGVPLSDSTVLNFALERIYGSISGTVKNEAGQPIAGVRVEARSSAAAASDTTDASGQFRFAHLPAASYTVTARKVGFVSDPVQRTVSLWQGGDVTGVDFTMTEARAARIQIVGPTVVPNSSAQKYSFVAVTEDQRTASVDVVWSVDFPNALDSLSQDGFLDPKDDYLGPLILSVADRYSGVSAQKPLSVAQPLAPGHASVQVANYRGVELILPDSSVASNAVVELRKPVLSRARRSARKFEVVGDVYQLSPENLVLLKPATLYLPVPPGYEEAELQVGIWDTGWLQWKVLEGSVREGNRLRVEITRLGRYAVLKQAEPLGIREVSVLPNPFSPLVGPLEIRYVVSSSQTSAPEVSLHIFNMAGDLVRELVAGEPQPRGENRVEWDGKTDYGRMARNGRYILRIRVRDVTGTKEKLVPFVLIK